MNSKPIMKCVGEENGFRYKYIRKGYCLNIPIKFNTDLTRKQWDKYLNGEYTLNQIRQFELTGMFNT